MVVSRSAEYALRAVIGLAAHPEETLSTARLAKQTGVPHGYLSTRILPALNRAGLIETNAGRLGGIRLARPPEDLSLLEVVRAVDTSSRLQRCPLGLESHRHGLCALHRRLDEAAATAEQVFAETTIAEVVAELPGKPFCDPGRS